VALVKKKELQLTGSMFVFDALLITYLNWVDRQLQLSFGKVVTQGGDNRIDDWLVYATATMGRDGHVTYRGLVVSYFSSVKAYHLRVYNSPMS